MMCITGVIHRCMNYMCNTPKHQTCITCVSHNFVLTYKVFWMKCFYIHGFNCPHTLIGPTNSHWLVQHICFSRNIVLMGIAKCYYYDFGLIYTVLWMKATLIFLCGLICPRHSDWSNQQFLMALVPVYIGAVLSLWKLVICNLTSTCLINNSFLMTILPKLYRYLFSFT